MISSIENRTDTLMSRGAFGTAIIMCADVVVLLARER